jgi:colanic acid/amylovoran biosynthesis glycosyltransferase
MTKKLSIGYLASCYPRAVDTSVRNEVLMLRKQGHTVHTFSVRRADTSQLLSEFHRQEVQTTTYLLSDHRIELIVAALQLLVKTPVRFLQGVLLSLRTKAPGLWGFVTQTAYFFEASLLARELQQQKISHLHNHIGENSASVAMLASTLSGVPYSITIHGPNIFRAPEKWALGEKIERSAFTVCITEFTKSQCMIYAPYPCWDKLHIVHCGPDPAFLVSDPPPLTDSKKFLWIGRICKEKAVPILLEAAKALRESHPDFLLVMVGDGPLRPTAEKLIQQWALGENVRLAGHISSEEIVEEMATSRAFVLPSFAEGLPAVFMEAMAMGRPVIGTYIAGHPELIEPGKNGWLGPAGAVEPFVGAMREALDMPLPALEEMGRNGRKVILERHDPALEAAKLATLIQQSLDRS